MKLGKVSFPQYNHVNDGNAHEVMIELFNKE